MIQVKTTKKPIELGAIPKNTMAHTKGLDEIDLWAAKVGKAEKRKREITPVKKHIVCT